MTSHQAPIFQRRPDLAEAAEAAERARKEAHRAQVQRTPQMESADLRARAEAVTLSLVTPLSIFAAGRSNFDCIVRGPFSGSEALAVIFSRLPLEEYGLDFAHADINRAGHIDGFPVWQVSKERSFAAAPDVAPKTKHEARALRVKPSKPGHHQMPGDGR